ncbi:MAG: M1 family metallopeptidase [Bacteroidales bacterium]|nr:M1 family metallopeptidase [Bacteroidales bacterium]
MYTLTLVCRKFFTPFVFILLLANRISGQEYWQQQVDYTINVSLDDVKHELNGYISIDYLNNSPHELDFIYFHLWPNAYRNNHTALAKQLLNDKPFQVLFNDPEIRGYMDSLNFKVNSVSVKTEPHPEHIDIIKVLLNNLLKPGEKINITTPFHVKLPKGNISRLGHIGQSYQITQWYPKPAVFDSKGWHPIPYLDLGEFYSEFGQFDVTITLPENYKVAATGELQTKSELEWLNKLAEMNAFRDQFSIDKTPESDKTLKSIRYLEKNVHDFAWLLLKIFTY